MLQYKKRRLPALAVMPKIKKSLITFLFFSAAAGFMSQPAISDDLLADIDASVQAAINRVCQPLQFVQSSQAYRDCLLQQLENTTPEADTFFRQLAALNIRIEQSANQSTAGPTSSAQVQNTAPNKRNTTTNAAADDSSEPAQLNLQPELSSTSNSTADNDRVESSTWAGAAIATSLGKFLSKPFSLILLSLALIALAITAVTVRMKRKASTRDRIKIAEAKAAFELQPNSSRAPAESSAGSTRTSSQSAASARHRSSKESRHHESMRHQSAETASAADASMIANKSTDANENVSVGAGTVTKAQISESELAILETSRHGFENWVSSASAPRKRDICSELLILTMAYTDNRFDPNLKKRIFTTTERDANTLIKRWAFKQDSQAFAYAIRVFQLNTNRDQRIQFIDLLLALLVAENALTPVQNNFLRFLSDAFGLGREILEQQYLRAFDEQMPSAPRPDKLSWWEPIAEETLFRWDAQSVALQPENIRYRVLLGLPLQGELSQESMLASYRRAVTRCEHERVNQLGEFEHELLKARRSQFKTARDALLEITA